MTGSTHSNHCSARSQRQTLEGPARDNLIAGPRTDTTRSEPSAPASAGAGGRHNEPGSQPGSVCPAQPPSKAGGASPWGGERQHGVGKPDSSNRERPDRTRRSAPHGATRHAREARRWPQPRHTDRCQATTAAGCRKPGERALHAANDETRSGAKQHQAPSGQTSARQAANPAPAGYGTTAVRMDECAPRGYPAPAGNKTAAVRMDECAPRGYPAPAGYESPPSGWTSERPAATPCTRNLRRNTPSEHTAEQEPSGQERRTPNAADRASTPVNRSQGAHDTVRASEHNTPSEHTVEQEPSGPGHRTHNTAHQSSTPVNRSQGSSTAHTQHNTPSWHTGEQEPSGPGHRTGDTTHGAGTPVNRS